MARNELDEQWEKRIRSLGLAVMEVERHQADGAAGGPELTELRYQLEADNRTSVLLILKARGENGGLVGFVGGSTLSDVLLSSAKKLRAGAVRWREDRPWSG